MKTSTHKFFIFLFLFGMPISYASADWNQYRERVYDVVQINGEIPKGHTTAALYPNAVLPCDNFDFFEFEDNGTGYSNLWGAGLICKDGTFSSNNGIDLYDFSGVIQTGIGPKKFDIHVEWNHGDQVHEKITIDSTESSTELSIDGQKTEPAKTHIAADLVYDPKACHYFDEVTCPAGWKK